MRLLILLYFLLALTLTGVSLKEQEDVVSLKGPRVRVRKMLRARKMRRGLKKMGKSGESGKSSSRAVFKGEDCDFLK